MEQRDMYCSDIRISFLTEQEFFQKYCSDPRVQELQDSLAVSGSCRVEICKDIVGGSIRVPAHGSYPDGVFFKFYLYGRMMQGNSMDGQQKNFISSQQGSSMDEQELCLVEENSMIQRFWEEVREKKDCLMSADHCLLEIVGMLSKDDILYLQGMEKEIGLLEDALMKGKELAFSRKFLYYRRKLSVLHYYYEQMLDVGQNLQAEYGRREQEDLRLEWQEFSGRLERLHDYVNYLREYMIQLRDLYHTQMDDRQNRGINFLTLVTSLFLPLTLLTGWYGMNFEYMPEVAWKYGYLMVIGVALAILAAEVIYIRLKKISLGKAD